MTVDPSIPRFVEIMALEPGWMNGQGKRVSTRVIVQGIYLMTVPGIREDEVSIFPTVDGGLRFEWDVSSCDITAELSTSLGWYLHWWDRRSDSVVEFTTNDVEVAGDNMKHWFDLSDQRNGDEAATA